MGRTLEFDRFMDEREKKTIDVRVFGKSWEAPASVPAWIPLTFARAERDGMELGRVSLRAAELLLGDAFVRETALHPEFSAEDLQALVGKLLQMILGGEEDGGVEAGAPGKG